MLEEPTTSVVPDRRNRPPTRTSPNGAEPTSSTATGSRIGKLEDVYVDVETDEAIFGTVKEGLFGRHLTFVPLGGITIGPDTLRVTVSRDKVKGAPDLALAGEELSQQDESSLYHYYELNYTPPETESGRRLARR